MIANLQYVVFWKCTGAVLRGRKETLRKTAAIEDIEVFVWASLSRFLSGRL